MFKSIFKSLFQMTLPTTSLRGDIRFAPIPRDNDFYCASTIFRVFRKRRTLFYTFIFITSAIILCPKPLLYAADVTLAWTGNTEPDLAGYYIYYKSGTSGAPYNGTGVDEGNSPIKIPLGAFADSANPEYTLHGLSDTQTSYLVLTAYDTEDNESGFSNEVSYQPSTAPTSAVYPSAEAISSVRIIALVSLPRQHSVMTPHRPSPATPPGAKIPCMPASTAVVFSPPQK